MPKLPPIAEQALPDWPHSDPYEPLAAGEVRVWLWPLETNPEPARRVLSADEIERADRFYFEPDRRHFTNARMGLRRLLAAQLGCRPQEVRFAYHGLGKPSLAANPPSDLRFNLSHSAGVAIVAITRAAEVGADIEAVRTSQWSQGIAQRYFSAEEAAALGALPAGQQDSAFFRFWTNKEAVVKLLGSGLGFPLTTFSTPHNPTRGARVALPQDNPLALGECWLQSLPAGQQLQAAVCLSEQPSSIQAFRVGDW